MKCSLATQSSNLMIEIDKVICMDKGVFIFICGYIYIYIYSYIYIDVICLYRYILFTLVSTFSYVHIFTYSFGSYRGLVRLSFVFCKSLHCNIY